jgi:hypothetical protein
MVEVLATPAEGKVCGCRFWYVSYDDGSRNGLTCIDSESLIDEDNNQTPGGTHEIHNPIYRRDTRGDPYKPVHNQPLSYRMWVALSVFRRDDLKYAVKVGIGAILYAMWSFVEPTRALYGHWRGEWGLLSYMLVCSMVRIEKCEDLSKYH